MGMRSTAAVVVAALALGACAGDPEGSDAGATQDTPPVASSGEAAVQTGGGEDATGSTAGEGTGSTGGAGDEAADTATAPGGGAREEPETGEGAPTLELPRGGTEFFPDFRLFGYSGAPLSEGLGRLGIGDLDERVVEMEERGEEFAGGRELMPVLELIATIVHPVPGADGMYRTHQPDEVVQDHLDAARRHDGILLLNIQPGRADFLDEVQRWEEFLVQPDVGVALDPEWAVGEGQVPGEVYGRTSGEELDEVAAYLAGLVEEHGLPEKVMVYHQVHRAVVRDEADLEAHDGVLLITSVDGIGAPGSKVATYDLVNRDKPDHVAAGFKLFYEEDGVYGPTMTGEEVLGLDPVPEYVLFE